MPTNTKVIFIRHSETEWNLQDRLQGQLDSPLTSLGQRQAKAVAQRVSQMPFDHLYSSDLGRTYQTAQAIAEITQHKIVADTRLREKLGGILQGLTDEEISVQYPDVEAKRSKGDPDYGVPGGESPNQVVARAVEILDYFYQNHTGQTVVAITHGGFLSALMRHILHIPLASPRRFNIYNTSLNILTCQNEIWTVQSMGDVYHLGELDRRDDIER